ncbi:MAG: hypothetical protein JO232_24005 [Verrucomicrobia bacterium]|nr:hypothetical protein [Verrucomicrobiota bacterium]
MMEELKASGSPVWRFVLERAVHEFNNRVGGILSVSEAHLSRRIDNRELRESLHLIRDGAQAASEFVVTIAELLTAEEGEPEMTRLSDLRGNLLPKLRLFLPSRIQISAPPCSGDAVIRVNANQLLFNLLTLLEHELSEEPPPSFLFELVLKVEGPIGWLIYHSTGGNAGAAQAGFCETVFSRMRPSLSGLDIQEKPSELEVAMGFPVVKDRVGSKARKTQDC